MIEGECNEGPEQKVVEALRFAGEQLQPVREIQNEFHKKVGKEKADVELFNPHPELKGKISEIA